MIAFVLIFVMAVLHGWFMLIEMLLWESPGTRAAFGTTEDFVKESPAMAANQGLSNGFPAAGRVWSLWLGPMGAGRGIALFFLACVTVAGIFGSMTVSWRILLVQAAPAALTALAVLIRA